MKWSVTVDRAFEQRRDELVNEMILEGVHVVDDVRRIASGCAAQHPFVHVGAGLLAGACMTARSPTRSRGDDRPRVRSLWSSLAALRWFSRAGG